MCPLSSVATAASSANAPRRCSRPALLLHRRQGPVPAKNTATSHAANNPRGPGFRGWATNHKGVLSAWYDFAEREDPPEVLEDP